MWSNDFPHGNTTWPNSRQVVSRDLGDLPAGLRAKLLRKNVAKLYNMPIPEPMPVPAESEDPSWQEWREERAPNYVGIS